MREYINKIKNSSVAGGIKNFLSSDFFPFITAALCILCYYLGLDIVIIAYIGLTGALIFLLLDDVTPVFTIFLFMGVMISYKNSPSSIRGNSNYYLRPEIFVPIIIVVVILVAAIVYRLVHTCVTKKFKFTPVFFGLCALAVTLLLNGANQKNYDINNLMFGGMMAVFFLGIFAVVKDNLVITKKTYEKIALSFVALGILLIIELIVVYFTQEKLITDGKVNRYYLIWGWGKYNYLGFLLAFCIPPTVYLAGVKKYGFIFSILSVLLLIACFFSYSRQTILCAAFIYVICLIVLFVKGKNKISNAVVMGVAVLAAIIVFAVKHEVVINELKPLFSSLVIDGELSGNGRKALWQDAIKNFKSSPIFGVGFYVNLRNDPRDGFSFIPSMYHNTVLQMMAACGIIGLIAYVVHRVQTVICYCKNITVERTMIALTIVVILLTSLVDHHIFSIFPTPVYSCLIAVLVKSEKKTDEVSVS